MSKIFDGDTFKTTRGEHIRLLGINTPEVAHSQSPGQIMGQAASKELARIISGKTVRLAFDQQHKDVYGRTLAQVYLRDGSWVNGEMVRRGMAHVYTFVPNLRWAEKLIRLEGIARQSRLGIWKTSRFSVLDAGKVDSSHLGQFRIVQGSVSSLKTKGWKFKLGRLTISVPRKYRSYFKDFHNIVKGDHVTVRGVVRASSSGLYLALHSPADVEMI
ncbi:MAG: thermonuclease family protein [Mariprofundaceae bacterium]|nr:thermonuclease family protein [Mariprofundaceae bacterium]